MQAITDNYINAINSKSRTLKTKAELYNGDALVATYTQSDAIKSITIDRVAEDSKFFGIGATHKVNIKLRDVERAINLTTDHYFKISIGIKLQDDTIEYVNFPSVYVTEVNRDEVTNELSITAYDILEQAKMLVFNDLELTAPYTIKDVVNAAGAKIGASKTITGKNLLDLNKSELSRCSLNEDGSITSNIENYYYSSIYTQQFNDVLINNKGSYFTFSIGEEITDKSCSIIIHGIRENGESWQESNSTGKKVTIQVANDFTAITNVELRFNRSGASFSDTKTTINNIQFEFGGYATNYTPYLSIFDLEYPDGANFEGTETLQDVLTAAAEATQTIYFINGNDDLVFKRLDKDGEAVKTLSNANYFDLDSKTNRRLATIASVTELGDNVSASITETGTTQYIRNNPFLELRDDIDVLLDNAIAKLGGITINQFECNWRGDAATEIGDKLALITKDGAEVTSYLLNDTISYNGALSQKTEWAYTESETVSSNPTTLGETLKQTFAKVDKANKQIEILTSETDANKSAISSLQINTENISASVTKMEQATNETLESINNDINTLTKSVEAKMTAEDVSIAIKSELANGVDKVETTTGFKFDETGLNISKTGSEMATNINEDGMSVYRNEEEVLTADNEGVKAYNLHAKTYMIIGETSRFEDYEKDGEKRTGCFWIGGE
jgi:hypothetical protein